jgi:hypothetical protein
MKTSRLSSLARRIPVGAVVLAAAALLTAPPAVGATRGALSLVPADATTVGFVRVADMRSNPFQLKVLDETDRFTADGDAGRFIREAGIDPRQDLDAVVATMTALEGGKGRVLVLFEGRFDRGKLSSALAHRGAVAASTPGGDYYRLKESENHSDSGHEHEPGAVAFIDSHLVIAGNEPAVVAALADRKAGGTGFASGRGLGRELHRIDPAATAWILADVEKCRKLGAERHADQGPAAGVMSALKNVSLVAVQASVDNDALALQATGLCADAETRSLIEDALRGLTAAWRMAAQEKSPELVSAIRKFEIRSNDEGVTISGKLPGELIRSLTAEARRHSGN